MTNKQPETPAVAGEDAAASFAAKPEPSPILGVRQKRIGDRASLSPVTGGPKEDRTPDLCIANAALSQLSYRPV